ncbi:MAG: helix-turn-helix domain-containing protein [Saprospiraceae bacterium]
MKNNRNDKQKLLIKNMVCRHCIEAVLQVFKALDLEIDAIRLGEVSLRSGTEVMDLPRLKLKLEQAGFELLEEKDKQIVGQIKTVILRMIHYNENSTALKNSTYISQTVGYTYAYLSKLFSREEGITIEKYIILQKIEHAKELLSYGELSLSEIAYQLSYKSVQHLSNQFKSITGMSVSQFKKLEDKPRKPLNEI